MKKPAIIKLTFSIVLGIVAIMVISCSNTTQIQKMQTLIDKDDFAGVQNEVSSGVDVNQVLVYAVNAKRYQIVKLLLDKGANPNKVELTYDIQGSVEKVDTNYFYRVVQGPGKTPLWYAIANQDKEMVKILLDKGAVVDRDYMESSATSDSAFIDLVSMSTGVIRQAFKVKSLKDSGFDPTRLAGALQYTKDGPEVIFEGCKWTDRYIQQQKLQVDYLRSSGSVAEQLSKIEVYNLNVNFPSANLMVPPKSLWQQNEIWVEGTMLVKLYVPVKYLPIYDKRQYITIWGDYGEMDIEDAHILSWTSSESAVRMVKLKGEDVLEGYVLSNVPPHQGSRRIKLIDFAKSTGNIEILRLLSETQRTK
jgi:ankyrin repeat protein